MTDPVDLDAAACPLDGSRSESSHLISAHARIGQLLALREGDKATIGTLRTQLAEAQLEATKLATSGHWTTHYAIDTPAGHVWYSRDRLPADVVVVATRPAWEGPAEPVEQQVDGRDGDQG